MLDFSQCFGCFLMIQLGTSIPMFSTPMARGVVSDTHTRLQISCLKREEVYETLPKAGDYFSLAMKLAIRSLRFNDNRDLVNFST
jgi:hypothetical protein